MTTGEGGEDYLERGRRDGRRRGDEEHRRRPAARGVGVGRGAPRAGAFRVAGLARPRRRLAARARANALAALLTMPVVTWATSWSAAAACPAKYSAMEAMRADLDIFQRFELLESLPRRRPCSVVSLSVVIWTSPASVSIHRNLEHSDAC